MKHLFVDEYQDTNRLQEIIYLIIAKTARAAGGSATVVGDDDQALYRFRGATVELFTHFPTRAYNAGFEDLCTEYLLANYRSTEPIVSFCRNFVELDDQYQKARVQGKPQIQAERTGSYTPYPVVGIFRETQAELAATIADITRKICSPQGWCFCDGQGREYVAKTDEEAGGPGDLALLCGTPREYGSKGGARLPLLLRQELADLDDPVNIYNPRGQELRRTDTLTSICGLMLICLDPQEAVRANAGALPNDAVDTFDNWRAKARQMDWTITKGGGRSLADYIRAWGERRRPNGEPFRDRFELLRLVYQLMTWVDSAHSDIEALTYVEALTRTIGQSALFASFSGEIVLDPNQKELEEASIREAYWNVFVPLALGTIDVNEDLLDTLPHDRLPVMSIHQSKGLEFPVLFVDVGSDFRTKHHTQAFKRFPATVSPPVHLEEELKDFSELDLADRRGLDRTFDDLVRQYYVAFSRAQDLLILVGLTSVADGYVIQSGPHRHIPNIGTGWTRDEQWAWGVGLPNLLRL